MHCTEHVFNHIPRTPAQTEPQSLPTPTEKSCNVPVPPLQDLLGAQLIVVVALIALQTVGNRRWILAAVEHAPDQDFIPLDPIIDRVGEAPGQRAVVAKHLRVDSGVQL